MTGVQTCALPICLSIIDLATGHQPISNEDGTIWIVFNGEIYNYRELRARLLSAGHHFETNSDTEVLVHLYEEHGDEMVGHLNGMFAFALWEVGSQTLFCARDRLGIKPFYYFWDGKTFAFASEIKALLEHPGIPTAFEDTILSEYLAFGYIASDQTMFRGIRKLMPGHWLRLQLDAGGPHFEVQRYWDITASTGSSAPKSDDQWIAECRCRLEETVRMRLMSDVPLGVFLSGGVDSSAIAALTARFSGGGPVKTFSVGYKEAAYSELRYAHQVAKTIGSDHRDILVGMTEFFDVLPDLIWHEDEPISWPSSVSLYFVSRLASEHVKVVLTGEGADE